MVIEGEGFPTNEGDEVNSENLPTGGEGRRAIAVSALLSGLTLTLICFAAALPPMAAAGPTEYPVRLCSPEHPGAGVTHNSNLGNVTAYTKAPNGTVTYGNVGSTNGGWSVWNPALRCAATNTPDFNGVSNFGARFFDTGNGIFSKNEEAGLQWEIPADLSLRQVGMKGRALQSSPSPAQGGIAEGGAFLKFDFIGGENKRNLPSTTYADMNGFSASSVQNAAAFRLGLICDPTNGGTVCMGGTGENALVNDLLFVMTDPTPPTVVVERSSLASGDWVRGDQTVTFTAQDTGSGLRETSVFIDGNPVSERTIPGCDLVQGDFAVQGDTLLQARSFRPCPTTPQSETVSIDATKFGDGVHTLKVCARDFAGASRMWNGDQKAAWSCTPDRTVKIDNTEPTAPESAEAVSTRIPRSVNPNDVAWTNPGLGDAGSPIHAAIYSVIDQAGNEVVAPTSLENGSDSTAPADQPGANNLIHIPTLDTPAGQGEFKLRIQLVDAVGFTSKPSEVPLSYSCENAGGTPLPQADIAMGLVEPQQPSELAKDFLGLDQGEASTVVGKVRGPGQMPINGADLCINAKPVVDPQLQLLSEATTNGNGNFSSALEPGPSRNLLTVFRQGHRETWSDPVRTAVTVQPTLSVGLKGDYGEKRSKAVIRSGQTVWFKGQVPGPYPDQVLVVLQGKSKSLGKGDRGFRAFRRYRTRFGGKFRVANRFVNTSTTRRAHLLIRSQVRNQTGYPYSEGNSHVLELVILPKKKHRTK